MNTINAAQCSRPGGMGSSGGDSASISSDELRRKVMDLNTSNKELLDLIEQVFSGENASPADQNMITALLSMRNSLATASSNAIRTIMDGISAIIRNLRA